VPFFRPKKLSQDKSLRNEVILHALNSIKGFDYVVLLQPTSPLRTTDSIDQAFKEFIESGAKSCVSVTEQHPSPEWIFKINEKNRIFNKQKNFILQNRQDLPKYYALNGAIYITSVDHFLNYEGNDPFVCDDTFPYVMNKGNSIDIDDEIDFSICSARMDPKNK
jgi:CMP-N-acetylneuraminic acid synthetase